MDILGFARGFARVVAYLRGLFNIVLYTFGAVKRC